MLPYIDIDAVEYCQLCKKPLALIELARDIGQTFKTTTVMRSLAAMANLPAYIVLYRIDQKNNEIDRFRMRQVYPSFSAWQMLAPDEYTAFLKSLRLKHKCKGGSANGE